MQHLARLTAPSGRSRVLRMFAVVLLLAVIAAACGDGEDTATPDPTADPETEAEATAEAEAEPTEAPEAEEEAPGVEESPQVSFEGETLRIIVGFGPGGGFDLVARLIAEQLPELLPGSPQVIVQNMPGASSMVAANNVYQMEPRDGRTIVLMHFGVVIDQILGSETAQFDAFSWNWLGEPAGDMDPGAIWVHNDLGIETMEDLRNSEETIFFGSPDRTAPTTMLIEHLKAAGFPVEMIYGFGGGSERDLAWEQRELDAQSSGVTELIYDDELASRVNIIGSLGTNAWLQEQGVPDIRDLDLGMTEEQTAFLDFLHLGRAHIRLFALPPDSPPERIEALRDAFEQVLGDPDVASELEALGLIAGFTPPEQIQETVNSLLETSPDMIEVYQGYAAETE